MAMCMSRCALALVLAALLALPAAAQQPKDAPAAKQKQTAPAKQPAAKKDNKKDTKAPETKKDTKAKESKSPQTAAVDGAQPTLLGQFGDWGAYTATAGGRKVCYALAKPASAQTNPANRPRDPAYMFVSTRPAENVRNEVSIVVGYPFKPASEASVDIGSAKYAMYTQNDGAWIKNAAEEARMVEAMRKGSEMIVSGESGRGTKSTDRYTLRGLVQALDRVAQECR
jgi:invasion associated locus B (IalB) protein